MFGIIQKAVKGIDSDSEEDSMPSLIASGHTDDEDSEADDYLKIPAYKEKVKAKAPLKPKNNAECADMWYKLSKDDKEKHIHVMKVYLLSPFLFGQVYQEDKWINWAYESELLPSKSSFDLKGLDEKHFDAVDLIETAFNKLAESALRKNKDGLVKTLDIIASSGLSMSQHLDKAVTCAESFLAFTNLREKIKLKPGIKKKQGDVALLLAHNQVSDHIKKLATGINLVEEFNTKCKRDEDLTSVQRKEGNDAFSKGMYSSALAKYCLALHMSPYNHVLYGNRAQAYLRTKDLWGALTDGRRAVVLKADWPKAQYRYAQAFYELGFVLRAKETNRAARKICSNKDLEIQYERFEKANEGKGKEAENKKGAKESKMPDDLPELVDANSSDTSRNSDDDYEGPPDLVEMEEASSDSLHFDSEGQSADISDGYESDDSSAQKKTTSASGTKERKTLKKARKGLCEAIRYQAKQEEKARKEEKEKKMAEHAAKKENKKMEKRTKKTKLAQLDHNGFSERKREFMAYLRQGSKAILEKKCMVAVRNYRDAMNVLEEHDFQYQVFDMKEIDFVILLYGFGAAYLELGGQEEVLEAKKQFDIILVKHKNVVFPLAFLGTGRVFYKQNRFAEALELLEGGLAFVNKVCEDLASYRWPGSSVEIDESKPEKLLSAIETLIKNCRHPPRPHAICRYPDCSNKSQIYRTDTDYKGYICLICDKDCKVEFHPVCWKKHKSSQEGKAGDKDFLEDACMTPDCAGIVVDIQIFDADGLKTEFKLEKLCAKMEAKPKAAKQNKVKPSGIAAKQKVKKAKDDVKIDDAASVDTGEEKEPTVTAAASASASLAAQKEEKPAKENHIQVEKGENAPSDSSASTQAGEGVFILKKEDDEEPAKGGGKAKTKKKKLKNTQTLDEFLKDRGGQQTFRPGFLETADEVDEITIPKGKFDFGLPPPAWSQHEMEAPFAIPPHLQGDAAQLEASYRQSFNMFSTSVLAAPHLDSQPQIDLQAVTDYVSSMLQEILRVNGPLELADPHIMQPLSMLPDNYQDIISNAGGLRPILEQSGEFLFQGNKVMLPEDKEIEDLVQTLKPQTDNPFLERINGTNDAKLGKSILDSDRNEIGTEEESNFRPFFPPLCNRTSSTPFNPDAKEFVPSSSQMDLLCNSSSGTSLTSDSSTLKEAELVDDTVIEEREQISTESQAENVTISNESKVENKPDSKESNSKTDTVSSLSKMENEPVSNASKVKKELVLSESKMESVENESQASDMIQNSVTQVIAETSTDAAAVKTESSSVNGTKFEDSTCDVAQTVAIVAPIKDTGYIPPFVDEETAQTQATLKRSGSEPVISNKAEWILTQPNMKSKGVGTDPIPERYKAEYQRATAEKDALQNSVTQVIAETSTDAAAIKTESSSVNGTKFEDSTCDVAQTVAIVAPVKDTGCIPPFVDEETAQTQATLKRSGSEAMITSKAKSVQTQPNVKSKGVGTDPIPERYKADYHRATAEKDALQARLHENTERLNTLLNKNTAEVDKVKRKLSDALQEKEKYSKELQDVKQKNLEEIRKLRQQCEDKEEKIKIMNKKLLQDSDDKSNVINGLRKELAACKGQFTSEKDSWTKERSEKEELLKNVKLQHQQQQARAQDAEIKLLELRRDVGLRFLERAYQESHVTINNLIQAVNARVAGPKVEELINTWKNYTVECHQRVVQCKDAFNEQIELLKNGRILSSVPQLTIPGPPPYPAIPVLQSLVPGQQQNQPQPQPAAESNTPPARPSDPPLFNAAAAPTGVPTASATPAGSTAAVNGDQANDAVRATTASVAPNPVAAADKARPSNSFEKIMLRLSTMYPNFTRLELTGFIKEVRHNKHGSLTGLSLEDIVTSVSELVDQKKKAGLLRAAPAPPTNNPSTQGSTKPVALPHKTQPAKPVQAVKPIAPEVTKALISGGSYEEDLCVICHDDMNTSNDIVILECGHRYHSTCIRKWLLGEQSTCPTCRVHALLPDEFPRLK